ncbi:MAG: PhnD/SsuA/transferrin family substrate-binding protein [candidate division KSB1 bacterium]|nr:PhnD/SsuA/transferrin family substrate-binding protein [candidate division KSB1 bacterium]MDZ7293919.1 PhnD/SsuA/transferrin family substrate-binding protein [candidate division KSB1 bacterium]MDZ7377984.1 PhnD/SsuA/transferrin family substrate-binding protein [candidate division KSB1 bacterium]MDZ7385893.1 PhnD/SsuA/transferrin family substrate-binding protein [candidate division KSB1 bacterium]MDZ7393035.1 PhnD/SsuA/transferrin family substrate-binding protein [candidate division KSB1 bact
MTRRLLFAGVGLILWGSISLALYLVVMNISTPPNTPDTTTASGIPLSKEDTVYVGVVSRFAPNLIYEGYQPIVDYLTERTPYFFILKLSNSYEETIQQLVRGEVQLAFVGTFVYLKARGHYPIRCILRPLNRQHQPCFRSVLITRTDSPIQSVTDLRAKRLAVPSPMSFSANWILRAELPRHGVQSSALAEVRHFDFHHTVVYEVLSGRYDAGVVKDRVAEEFSDKGIRIVLASPPIPGSPLIVRKDLDTSFVQAIRQALLSVDTRKQEYQQLVSNWDAEFVYGFAVAEDNDYDYADTLLTVPGDDL